MTARLPCLVAFAVLAVAPACRPGPGPTSSSTEHAGSGTATGSIPAEGSADGEAPSPGSGDGAAEMPSTPPPVRPEDQVCGSADDCRVFQPGDWNPRVECCYEYACDLDYRAVNLETWGRIRDWQRAHPFDCTEHLGVGGPCTARSPRCGLVQDAPAPACVDGLCTVALPEVWPAVDPEAQRCSTEADCLPWRPASASPEARCCNAACDADWVAINRATAHELDRWLDDEAPSCESWRAIHECPPAAECNLVPPAATCRGGECVLGDLPATGTER